MLPKIHHSPFSTRTSEEDMLERPEKENTSAESTYFWWLTNILHEVAHSSVGNGSLVFQRVTFLLSPAVCNKVPASQQSHCFTKSQLTRSYLRRSPLICSDLIRSPSKKITCSWVSHNLVLLKEQPIVCNKQAYCNILILLICLKCNRCSRLTKNIWPPSEISNYQGRIWLKQTLTDLMCFSNLCGKLMGLLSIQIKLAFNDMLDKS